MEPGEIGVLTGPVLAASDAFDIEIKGKGGHAALQELCIDPILTTSHLVGALKSLVNSQTNALEAEVVTVTQIHAGDAYNVIPDSIRLCRSIRTFKSEIRENIHSGMKRVAERVAEGFGAKAILTIKRGCRSTINSKVESIRAASAGGKVVVKERVILDTLCSIGSEDFSLILQALPICYIWLGNGNRDGGCFHHNPHYEFNDKILPIGASFWISLIEQELPL